MVITHPELRRRGNVAATSLCTSQWRSRYVSNETPNDVSMERRQDVSVVRLHDVPLARLYDVSCKSQIKHQKNVVVCLHHVSELRFGNVLLVDLYYTFKLLCRNLHLIDF